LEEFDIRHVLPESFDIRDADLVKSSVISVPAVPDDFQSNVRRYCEKDTKRTTDEEDRNGLFSHECIQYIAARLVNDLSEKGSSNKKQKQSKEDDDEEPGLDDSDAEDPNETQELDENDYEQAGPSLLGTKRRRAPVKADQSPKASKHPLWDRLAAVVRDTWRDDDEYARNATCPKGMSTSRLELIKTMATNHENIWKAKMYLDLKRAVVRSLLRIHLRPLGEEKYRDQKKKHAEKKASKAAEKLKSPYVRRKAHRWTLKKLFLKLELAIKS
jgi:hypothetical protein